MITMLIKRDYDQKSRRGWAEGKEKTKSEVESTTTMADADRQSRTTLNSGQGSNESVAYINTRAGGDIGHLLAAGLGH
jgi:hypothetical protein